MSTINIINDTALDAVICVFERRLEGARIKGDKDAETRAELGLSLAHCERAARRAARVSQYIEMRSIL